jgi:hypothetical protein
MDILAALCFAAGLFFLVEAVMVWRSPEFQRDLARLRANKTERANVCRQGELGANGRNGGNDGQTIR